MKIQISQNKFSNKNLLFTLIFVAILIMVVKFCFSKTVKHVANLSPSIDQQASVPEVSEAISKIPLFSYIQVIDGCNAGFIGTCLNIRSGLGVQYPVISRLRIGQVLKVETVVIPGEAGDTHTWYRIVFDAVRYPERVTDAWYVAVDPESIYPFEDIGDIDLDPSVTILAQKRIVVDLSEQMLYAYDDQTLFMQESISTGVELDPTPVGLFTIYRKTPSRYMQGPLPGISDEYYDFPGVPWDMYFTSDGAVLHGAYWHNDFGQPRSHGCVNQTPENAKKLYEWADVGTPVVVQN